MIFKPALCRALFLSLIAAAAAPANAALYLSISADTKNQPNPDAKAPPSISQQAEVVLADDYIRYRIDNTSYLFDFARRRHYVIDESAKIYDESPLFDVVGFRELELRNRQGLRAALAAAKLDSKSSQLEDEHELAVQGTARSMVNARVEGDDEVFAIGDATLLRRSKQGTPVGAADAARFVQFLRYSFAGHPAVLEALQKEQQIPARLSYSFHPGWGVSTVDLKIAVRQADAPTTPALAGYAPRPPAREASTLDQLVDRAWASRSTLAATMQPIPTADALAAQIRNQRPLDAYLTISEHQLTDGRIPVMTDEQKAAFQTDPTMQALARAVSAKDPNGMRQAVGALEMLRMQAQSKRYLLSLFEANDRAQLGEMVKARSLYTEVLQSNPTLAGAYKDIGDFYYRSFDTPHAWRSWEIARALAPLFPTLGTVDQYERSLTTRFPEYF